MGTGVWNPVENSELPLSTTQASTNHGHRSTNLCKTQPISSCQTKQTKNLSSGAHFYRLILTSTYERAAPNITVKRPFYFLVLKRGLIAAFEACSQISNNI